MLRSMIAPTKYFQGNALLADAYRHVSHIGRRFVIIADDQVKGLIETRIKQGFRSAGSECVFLKFNGETSLQEIWRLTELAAKENCSGIIGAGGGKAMDTAKMVGDLCGLPIVSIPTCASNDAACSYVASIYTEDGNFLKAQKLKEGPAVVLADTEIIANAPVRLMVAGIGEAFATYYETRACERSGIQNYTGAVGSHTSVAMAKLCRNLLLKYGEQAIKDTKDKKGSRAIENVIEANIYLSAVSFQNNGCAAAQAIYNGMTVSVKPFHAMHGEGIAFGTLIQLIMEYREAGQWNEEEWEQIVDFYRRVGLPRRFEQLGIADPKEGLLHDIARESCRKNANIHNMPFEATEDKVYRALIQLRDMDLD